VYAALLTILIATARYFSHFGFLARVHQFAFFPMCVEPCAMIDDAFLQPRSARHSIKGLVLPLLSPVPPSSGGPSRGSLRKRLSVAETRMKSPSPKAGRLRVEDGKDVGVGGHAKIMLGRYNGRRVAVKAMPRKDPQTQVEIAVSSRLQAHPHPHVIVTLPPVPSPDSKHIFLPMELADQDLLAHTDALGGLEECEASLLFLQVARGLRHLHGAGIYHLDVKPENVLMVGGLAKVSDFGTAHCCDPKFSMSDRLTSKPFGTPIYACPEAVTASSQCYQSPLLREHVAGAHQSPTSVKGMDATSNSLNAYDAELADVWSLGVSLYVTVTGFFPWKIAHESDKRYAAWVSAFQSHFGTAGTSEKFASACQRILGVSNSQRGTALSMEFFDLVRRMLHPDPAKRLSMKAVEGHPFFTSAAIVADMRTY
jgi:serine/threonine protein kinase